VRRPALLATALPLAIPALLAAASNGDTPRLHKNGVR
jgi:hypothetical protein